MNIPTDAASQLIAALNTRDTANVARVLTSDFTLEDVAGAGEASIRTFTGELEVLFRALPDVTFLPVRRVEVDGRTVVEFRAFGTHLADFLSVAPTGTTAFISGVFNLCSFDDRVSALRMTVDFGGLRRQLLMASRGPSRSD